MTTPNEPKGKPSEWAMKKANTIEEPLTDHWCYPEFPVGVVEQVALYFDAARALGRDDAQQGRGVGNE